jgi:hypothetical protein
VYAKFVEISFCDKFIDFSTCFLSPYSYILDHRSYGLGPKERKEVLYHNALVTTHACSIMVFISSIDMLSVG